MKKETVKTTFFTRQDSASVLLRVKADGFLYHFELDEAQLIHLRAQISACLALDHPANFLEGKNGKK